MKVYVVSGWGRPSGASRPHAVLRSDSWDDYGYKTMFTLEYIPITGDTLEVGGVKIARLGQERGERSIDLLPRAFNSLDSAFGSLGQDHAYYEALMTLPKKARESLLTALRDAAWDPEIEEAFQEEDVWDTSVLRFGGSQNVTESARRLLRGLSSPRTSVETFTIATSVGGSEFTIGFKFADPEFLASRINAVIGYNGTGKTRLLANMAMLAHADETERNKVEFRTQYGRFVDDSPRFSAIINISYSAFDTFELPQQRDVGLPPNVRPGETARSETEFFGYSYCGLRDPSSAGEGAPRRLKSADELGDDFVQAFLRARRIGRDSTIRAALASLALEPSISRAGELAELEFMSAGELLDVFEHLSTGHKIIVTVVAHLCLRLQPRSLVLMDEPEAHLHPSLLAALLRAVGKLLEEYDSCAIAATHSPVVLQEVPATCVRVLRRSGSRTSVRAPKIETFGENVGLITSHVFHIDATETDHHELLKIMANELTLPEAEARFPSGMSVEARGYFLARKRGGTSA